MTLFDQNNESDQDLSDWRSVRLVSVDIEGNGCHPPDIVELAVVEIVGGAIGRSISWLVKPESRITWHASNLHGIHNKDVENSPSFSEVALLVTQTLGDAFLVAHNASVEKNLLARKVPTWKPLGIIDTLRLARKTTPGLESYSLASLAGHFGLNPETMPGSSSEQKAHRALFDATLVAQLLIKLAINKDGSIRTLRELTQ